MADLNRFWDHAIALCYHDEQQRLEAIEQGWE